MTPLSRSYAESVFWWEDAGGRPSGEVSLPASADVVVVGGGYTGVTAGWELARRGKSVLVLEAEALGYGASTRNGGMVLPGFKAGMERLEQREGERGRDFYRYSVAAVVLVERIIREQAIDCAYQPTGHLELAYRPSHAETLKTGVAAHARILGDRVRFVERDALEQEIGSSAYFGGMLVEVGGGLHPARYHAGLVRAARQAGAVIADRTRVTALTRRRPAGFRVLTVNGAVEAEHVLLATNGYTTGLVPAVQRRVVPVGSYIIVTEPLDAGLAHAISPRGRMFFDTKNFLYYWRVLPDGRMLFGGRASFAPTTIPRARDWLYTAMVRVHPQLQGVAVRAAWGGRLGFTMDRLPHLGRVDGVTYALGYCGTGIAMATTFGRQAAAWIAGDQLPACLSRPFPLVPLYGGTPWFLPAVGLYYRWHDARS